MQTQILVALQSENPLGRILPYLDTVAQPNTRVVLLIPYCKIGTCLRRWRGSPETVDPGGEITSRSKACLEWESSEDEKSRLAELRIALAEYALRRKGVDLITDIYMGSLRNAIKSYKRNGNIRLIIMRKKFGVGVLNLLQSLVRRVRHAKNQIFHRGWYCSIRSTVF